MDILSPNTADSSNSTAAASDNDGFELIVQGNWVEFGDWIVSELTSFGIRLLYALLVLIIGFLLIRFLLYLIRRAGKKRGWQQSAISFFVSAFGAVLKLLLIFTCISMLNIETLSATALLASLGVAVGFALSGMLGHFASGAYLAVYRPIRIGDLVEIPSHLPGGVTGHVRNIDVLNTMVELLDGRQAIVPNSAIANFQLIKTGQGTDQLRRLDQRITLPWSDDVQLVRKVLLLIMQNDDRILKDPAPTVVLNELTSENFGFQLIIRPWVHAKNWLPVLFSLREKIKEEFDRVGILFQISEMNVNLDDGKTSSEHLTAEDSRNERHDRRMSRLHDLSLRMHLEEEVAEERRKSEELAASAKRRGPFASFRKLMSKASVTKKKGKKEGDLEAGDESMEAVDMVQEIVKNTGTEEAENVKLIVTPSDTAAGTRKKKKNKKGP